MDLCKLTFFYKNSCYKLIWWKNVTFIEVLHLTCNIKGELDYYTKFSLLISSAM